MNELLQHLRRGFLNPLEAMVGIVEATAMWWRSRSGRLTLTTGPVLLLAVGFAIYVTILGSQGSSYRVGQLLTQSDEWLPLAAMERQLYRDVVQMPRPRQQAKDQENITADASEQGDEVKTDADLASQRIAAVESAMRRVLQIDPSSAEAQYRLALSLALQGEMPEAEDLVQSLALREGVPHYAANHWYAIELLKRQASGEEVDRRQLRRAFGLGSQWRSALTEVRLINSDLLAADGKMNEALDLAMETASDDPTRYLAVAIKAKAAGKQQLAREALVRSEKYYTDRLQAAPESIADRLGLAETLVAAGRETTAAEILQSGLTSDTARSDTEGTERLRRRLSDLHLANFRESYRRFVADKGSPSRVYSLDPLVRAAETDPLNPALGEMIAQIIADQDLSKEVLANDVLSKIISRQRTAGVLSTTALRLLGQLFYASKKYEQAETFWRQAIERDKTDFLSLNNLAYMIYESDPERLEDAHELIERAAGIAPQHPEVQDTQGQILLAAGHPQKAIPLLEASLRRDPGRQASRQLLAKAYEQLGQTKIAEAYASFGQ